MHRDRFVVTEMNDGTFGTTANSAGQMGQCRGAGTARQNEFFKRGEIGVVLLRPAFKEGDVVFANTLVSRDTDFATQIKQVVLYR